MPSVSGPRARPFASTWPPAANCYSQWNRASGKPPWLQPLVVTWDSFRRPGPSTRLRMFYVDSASDSRALTDPVDVAVLFDRVSLVGRATPLTVERPEQQLAGLGVEDDRVGVYTRRPVRI